MNSLMAEIQKSQQQGGACVQSGYCCTVTPCKYGHQRPDQSECLYLAPPIPDTGQRYCEIVTVIRFLERNALHPMVGGGCSSTLFNADRDRVIEKLKK
jgi:hypothetical protein